MKLRVFTPVLILGLVTTMVACEKPAKDGGSSVSDQSENSILLNSTLASLNESLEDQSGSKLVANYSEVKKFQNPIEKLLVSNAYASDECTGRAVNEECDNGTKFIAYINCSLGKRDHRLSGNVSLTYSNSECSLEFDGDYVKREFDLQRTTHRGAVITRSSEEHQDYNEETIGGGSIITQLDGYKELEILGVNRKRTSVRGRRAYNISVRSLGTLEIDQELIRKRRKIKNGTIMVSHNLAKFTSTVEFQNVEYSDECCHPVAGSLNIDFEGSREGGAVVTFNGCGQKAMLENLKGEIEEIEMEKICQ